MLLGACKPCVLDCFRTNNIKKTQLDASFPWILVWWMGFSVVKRQVMSPAVEQLGALENPAQHDRCNDNVCTGCLDWLVVVSPRCVTKRFGCVCEVWISVPECGECVVAFLPLSLSPLPLHELVRAPGKGRALLDILPGSAFKADFFFWEAELLSLLAAGLSFAPFSMLSIPCPWQGGVCRFCVSAKPCPPLPSEGTIRLFPMLTKCVNVHFFQGCKHTKHQGTQSCC